MVHVAIFSSCLTLFFSFFLRFRFAARHLLLITANLHPQKDENSDIHTPREDDRNDLFISKSKKKRKRSERKVDEKGNLHRQQATGRLWGWALLPYAARGHMVCKSS